MSFSEQRWATPRNVTSVMGIPVGRLNDLDARLTALENNPPSASSFISLTDTPSSYAGQTGKVPVVNGTETGLIFTTISGTDEKVKLNASDPTAGYLDDKIVEGAYNVSIFTNDAGYLTALTPWTSDVDAAFHNLNHLKELRMDYDFGGGGGGVQEAYSLLPVKNSFGHIGLTLGDLFTAQFDDWYPNFRSDGSFAGSGDVWVRDGSAHWYATPISAVETDPLSLHTDGSSTMSGDIHFNAYARVIDWQIEGINQFILGVDQDGNGNFGLTLTDEEAATGTKKIFWGAKADNTAPSAGDVMAYDGAGHYYPVTPSSGGTPGGSDTQVQFNDGGSFGGDAGMVYNKTTNYLTTTGGVESTYLLSKGADPYVDLYNNTAADFAGLRMRNSGNLDIYVPAGANIKLVGANALDMSGVYIKGQFTPDSADAYDIGDPTHSWAGCYLGPNELIYFNNIATFGTDVNDNTLITYKTGKNIRFEDPTSTLGIKWNISAIATADKTVTAPNRSLTLDHITTATTAGADGFVKSVAGVITFDTNTYYKSGDTVSFANITDTGLTASKVVFTDSSKKLTSTGIGTSSQFIKGDGSLDSNTYITGNQTINLSGDVSGSGTNSIAVTIANNAVTYAKFQQVAASSLVGNPTGSLANAQAISLGAGLAFTGTSLYSTLGSALNKTACRVATTANLTATYSNGSSGVGATLTNSGTQAALSIDGITMAVNDRVLVWQQSTQANNGIYVVTNIGSGSTNWVLTRATDCDGSSGGVIAYGFNVQIVVGTLYAAVIFVQTSPTVVTVGTDPISFVGNAAASGGSITSVTNADGTLTISPTTGLVVASLNLAHANTWTASQTWRAGTTTAGTAPFYMQSGSLLTAAAVGAEEFLTDKRYITITTGTARKEYALLDAAGTTGRMVFTTTNGRLLDSANATYTSTTGLTITAGATSAVPIISKLAASQTADGFQIIDSASAVVAKIDVNGTGTFGGTGQSTIQKGLVVNNGGGSAANDIFTAYGTSSTVLLQAKPSSNTAQLGLVDQYNAINTVRNGLQVSYAAIDLTAQSAAITATTAYAVPASATGMYRICWVATVTTAASTSSVLGGTNGFQIAYTDGNDSVVKTSIAGQTSAANTTATTTSGVVTVYAKASTNIQYTMDYTSVGVTAMQYNLHVTVSKL